MDVQAGAHVARHAGRKVREREPQRKGGRVGRRGGEGKKGTDRTDGSRPTAQNAATRRTGGVEGPIRARKESGRRHTRTGRGRLQESHPTGRQQTFRRPGRRVRAASSLPREPRRRRGRARPGPKRKGANAKADDPLRTAQQVFLSEEPEEADYDETEGYTNAYLVVPRRQAWKNTCIRKVNEFTKNLDGQAKRLQAMERKMDPALGLSLDERLLVEKLLLEDERTRLEALKKEIEAEKKAAGEKAPPTGGVAQ